MTTERSKKTSTSERKAKLEDYIRKNPRTSTDDKERLEELEREEREQGSGHIDVLY